MKILITAGSTNCMIDKVRCISNIFKGTTGKEIAIRASGRNHEVTLLSNTKLFSDSNPHWGGVHNILFNSYDQLALLMENKVFTGNYDAIIHSAAVSDYSVDGTYIWEQEYVEYNGKMKRYAGLKKIDSSKKISSSHDELYLRLVPTEKIIDKIKDLWGFKGKLVKFKLQVGISDEELLKIAEKSMHTSKADIIVANCLEWSRERAYICYGIQDKNFISLPVDRNKLADCLLDELERRSNG